MSNKLNLIISRRRKGQQQGPSLEQQIAKMLSGQDALHVALVPHLYDLAPDGPVVRYLRALEGHMAVLAWLYPRAAYWVLQANGITGRMGKTRSFPVEEMEPGTATDGGLPGAAGNQPAAAPSVRAASGDAPQASRTIWCFDLRRYGTVESLVAELDAIALQSTGRSFSTVEATALAAAERLLAIEEVAKQRWYPVVDYSRCGNCLECLNFCLFGVFGLSDGRLVVEEPDACRPGCPACARVCPSQAIMFPQHADPFIAGDPTASPQPPDAESLKQLGLTIATPAVLQPGTMASAERARALLEKAAGAGAAPESPGGSTAAPAETAGEGSAAEPSDSTDGAISQHQPADDPSTKLSRLVDDLEQSDL